jgi:hypothetical protein
MHKLTLAVLAMSSFGFPVFGSNGEVTITTTNTEVGVEFTGSAATRMTQLLQAVPKIKVVSPVLVEELEEAAAAAKEEEKAQPSAPQKAEVVAPTKTASTAPVAPKPYDVNEADRLMPNGLDAFAKDPEETLKPDEEFAYQGKQITCFPKEESCAASFDAEGRFTAPVALATPYASLSGKVWLFPDDANKGVTVTFDREAAQTVFNFLDSSTFQPIGYTKRGPSIRCVSAAGEAQCSFALDAEGNVTTQP